MPPTRRHARLAHDGHVVDEFELGTAERPMDKRPEAFGVAQLGPPGSPRPALGSSGTRQCHRDDMEMWGGGLSGTAS
jgi:hypothetical protein